LADPHFLILRRHPELMEVAHVTVVMSEESPKNGYPVMPGARAQAISKRSA
jgi:hypothetical protein